MFVYRRKKRTNNQTAEYNQNNENTKVKDLQRRAISELKIGCSIKECVTKRLWYILLVFFCAELNNIHYFLTFVTFLLSLPYGKGTKNMCKIYATLNFFSAVADNITVKTKRKSNLENNNFILCFATSPFY